MIEYGPQLAEGKTKRIYAHPTDPRLAYMVQKDAISAGDGVRRDELAGKGALSGRTAASVFSALNAAGVRTHFHDDLTPEIMVVLLCAMLPLEVVMRRLATGSYCRRHPEVEEGTRFDPPLVEFFLKDDASHDPQIDADGIVARDLATPAEIAWMVSEGRRVFTTLEQLWLVQGIHLVDLKIEFGRDPVGQLMVGDMIDNDSWRLWPGGDKNQMLDKQIYRNMHEVTPEALELLKDKYAEVRDRTERFRPD